MGFLRFICTSYGRNCTGEWEVRGPATAPRRPSFAKPVVGVYKATEFSFASGYPTNGLTPLAISTAVFLSTCNILFCNLSRRYIASYVITNFSHRLPFKYSHAPHNDVSVNDRPHIGQWSQKIII